MSDHRYFCAVGQPLKLHAQIHLFRRNVFVLIFQHEELFLNARLNHKCIETVCLGYIIVLYY